MGSPFSNDTNRIKNVKNQTIDNKKMNQISGSLQTVHPSMWTTDQNLGSDCPSHGQTRTLDQDNTKVILRWTSGRIFDHGPCNSWTESDDRLRLTLRFLSRWTDSDLDERRG